MTLHPPVAPLGTQHPFQPLLPSQTLLAQTDLALPFCSASPGEIWPGLELTVGRARPWAQNSDPGL